MKGKDMNYLFSFFHSEEEDCLMIYSPTGKILVAQGNEISMMEKKVDHGTRSHCWNLLKWENKYKTKKQNVEYQKMSPMEMPPKFSVQIE